MDLSFKILLITIILCLLSFHLETIINILKFIGIAVFLILFVIYPIVFKLCYPLQRSIFFLSYVNRPLEKDLINVNNNKIGIPLIRNFYLTTDENIRLGLWHILPNMPDLKVPESDELRDEYYERMLANGRPIVIYMHGNSGSRLSDHRVQLYKVILSLHYHIVTFDYRNYGDSTAHEPTEEGLVSDGIFVYNWVLSKAQGSPVFLWGHSLGTGVSSHIVEKLDNDGFPNANGLILESPFNNMRDEICEHPFAIIYRYLPLFSFFFLDPVKSNGICFESDRHLVNSSVPVLILHAKDDFVVPFVLGQRLYETVKRDRPAVPIEFIGFEGNLKYGHNRIYKAPDLSNIISNFVNKNLKMKESANNSILENNEKL